MIPPSGRQGCHTRAQLGWSSCRWGGPTASEEGGRRQGAKRVRALFVLVVASFPSDTEVKQDGGGVSMSEQTLLQKWDLISSLVTVTGPGVHLQFGVTVACWPEKNRNAGLKSNLKQVLILILYLCSSFLKFVFMPYLHTQCFYIKFGSARALCQQFSETWYSGERGSKPLFILPR